ncbi:MAG: tetratricopeptide repeat protein [Candidatus Thorarchaeota archaeon]
MSELGRKELEQAKKLIREGKYEDSLRLLNDFEEKKHNSLEDIVSCHLIKSRLFFGQGLFKKAAKFAEQTYKESLGLKNKIISVDALLIMAHALLYDYNVNKAKNVIKQVEEILKTEIEEPITNRNQREALIMYLKGMALDPLMSPPGDQDLALKYYNQSLALAESLGDNDRVISCLIRIAWIIGIEKGILDLSLDYIEKALALTKGTSYKLLIAWTFLIKATIYHHKGEISRSISLYMQSLEIAKEINHKMLISANLNNMADAYRMNGELDHALECSELCIKVVSETGNLNTLASSYDYLIQILVEKGELEKAQQSLTQLEKLKSKLHDRNINDMYLYNEALILKESSRISNRGKAEEILKQLLEDEDVLLEIKERTLLTLCELLLLELQMTANLEVLQEVESFIVRLLDIAEKSHSYWIWGETYLLQAKLALISLDLEEARRLMTQGQRITEEYGLNLLAKKISNEHDQLLNQLSEWENLKESNAPFNERIKLAGLNEQMENMIHKRVRSPPILSDEVPVLLIMLSEGGIPIFSQSFIKDQVFENHIFAGFLSAINSFISEMFSEGLDRVIFGEHTILVISLPPFFICYVFKGQSYSAQLRIKSFMDEIVNDKDVWETFEQYYQTNQAIQLKDIPTLEPLIKEIFIDRTIDLTK